MRIKLSEWAKQNGVCYKTAWRWFHEGKLPCKAVQISTGTILVETEYSEPKKNETSEKSS
jgi:predicted site-specific integrase-resolvase